MNEERWKNLKLFRRRCGEIQTETGYTVDVMDCAHFDVTSPKTAVWVNDRVLVFISRPSGMPVEALEVKNFQRMKVLA